MKCSEGLRTKVPESIRRYIDHMKSAVHVAFPFITLFQVHLVPSLCHYIYGCVFCVLLFNFC